MPVRHSNREDALLAFVFVRVAASVHHPCPTGLDPRHACVGECGGGGESLLLDRGACDGLGIGLVDCDGFFVIQGADLSVGDFGGLGMGGHGKEASFQ